MMHFEAMNIDGEWATVYRTGGIVTVVTIGGSERSHRDDADEMNLANERREKALKEQLRLRTFGPCAQ